MLQAKKQLKENQITEAAERVFSRIGYKNAKMEQIASEAGITKVTLYSYFQSKENLYMAITYRVLQQLNDSYYQIIEQKKNSTGLECTIALIKNFISFCEQNYFYSEVLLEYFSLIRSTSSDTESHKLTEAMKDSLYFTKVQDIHNLAFKLTGKQIERGIKDGSIPGHVDPMLYTLHGWTSVIGYVKVLAASGNNVSPLFNVNLAELKHQIMYVVEGFLSGEFMLEPLNV